MPGFDKVLQAIGPNAAIIFAAWAAMQFLQTRFNGAYQLYLDSIEKFRTEKEKGAPHGAKLKEQALRYRRRCELMARATKLGMVAAMLLISSILLGLVDALWPKKPAILALGTGSAAIGFACVLAAAAIVLAEGRITQRQIHDAANDVPELKPAH